MEELTFMAVDPTCVALRQICGAPERFYKQLGFNPMIRTPEEVHSMSPKYLIGNRVGHAPGVLQFIQKTAQGSRTTYYLDDYLPLSMDVKVCIEVATMRAVANQYLENYIRPHAHGKEIIICNTHIDVGMTDLIAPSSKNYPLADSGRIKLFFASIGGIGMDFISQLCNALPPGKFQMLVIVYTTRGRWPFTDTNVPKLFLRHLPWTEYIAAIKAADIVLQPTTGEGKDILSGKSHIKWLNAAASKTLFICHDSKPYNRVVKHMENGIVAGGLAEWLSILNEYLHDRSKFYGIIEQAYKDVDKNWNTKDRALDYLKAFTGLELNYESIR